MLSIREISKSFGQTCALCDVSFDVHEGESVAVLGPSGSGKSTLLSIIAGLEIPDEGDIRWDGQSLRAVPPHQRGFGLMFQDFALFPHLNVFDNVAFGLRTGTFQGSIEQRVAEMLALVGLSGLDRRDVNTLSGGEQQRVALARSLAPRPRLLMLDEPLGSLDRNLRQRLTGELRLILTQIHQTALYVTHDLEEAFTLAGQVVLMNAGRVEQMGAPDELYCQPATRFTAAFLGLTNQIEGIARQGVVETALGSFPAPVAMVGPVVALIRPDAVHLGEGVCTLEGIVVERVFRGPLGRVVLKAGEYRLAFDFPSNVESVGFHLPGVGERIRLGFDPQRAVQILLR